MLDQIVELIAWQNTSTRPSTFERPPTLGNPLASTYDIGKRAWSNDRSIWNANTSVKERTVEGGISRRRDAHSVREMIDTDSDQAHLLRQSSASSAKFIKPLNNNPLSQIENSRNPKSSGMGWAGPNARSIDYSCRPSLASPKKQTQSSWLFSDRLDLDAENSSLLADSAPEHEYSNATNSRNDNSPNRNPYASVKNEECTSSYFGFETSRTSGVAKSRPFQMEERKADRSATNTQPTKSSFSGPFPERSSSRREMLSTFSTDPAPKARGFGSGFGHEPAAISPTQSRFKNQSNTHMSHNSSIAITHDLAHHCASLGVEPCLRHIRGDQPEDVYTYDLPHLSDTHSPPLHTLRSQPQALYGGDLMSNSAGPPFELGPRQTVSGPYHSIWNYGDHEMPSPFGGDYKHSLNSPFYSATGTPPTGSDSVRSTGGSGISSRTSHHEITLVDRKLRNLDLYQSYQHAHTDGYLSAPATGYDLSMHHSTMRMNPLAAPYHVGGNGNYACTYPSYLRTPPREQEQVQVIRSPLLEEFRTSNKTNKRYELRDIFDHVVEFSGDQHGSRFIQQKLETANSDEKDQVFKEIQPNALQLMTDLFGNYVIQKMFEHGNQSQKKLLANNMRGHVLTLSMQMYGCRVVQKALEHVLTDQQASMVKELDGPNKQVLKVIRDQNGNHVVQKAIERVPAEHIQFIIDAHKGEAVKLATHTYGCRVIQRILEHCQPGAKRVIMDEIHGCMGPLITDSFGNYVVQHVIQNGEPQDRRQVVSIVQHQLLIFSKHKFASNVVEKCIEYADDDQRGDIVRKLIGHNEQGQTPVLGLLRDQYGNYVIRKSRLPPLGIDANMSYRENPFRLEGNRLRAVDERDKALLSATQEDQLWQASHGN